MSEWQPIETAPRDGTAIHARREEKGFSKKPNMVKWLNGKWVSTLRPEIEVTNQPTHWEHVDYLRESVFGWFEDYGYKLPDERVFDNLIERIRNAV